MVQAGRKLGPKLASCFLVFTKACSVGTRPMFHRIPGRRLRPSATGEQAVMFTRRIRSLALNKSWRLRPQDRTKQVAEQLQQAIRLSERRRTHTTTTTQRFGLPRLQTFNGSNTTSVQ